MLLPWAINSVNVQRRASNPARNSLNEPNYGQISTWTTVYSALAVRIEYDPEKMTWNETGERVNPSPSNFFMYVPDLLDNGTPINLFPEDRITIVQSDDNTIIGRLYVVTAVFGEWDSLGNRHHSIIQMQVP